MTFIRKGIVTLVALGALAAAGAAEAHGPRVFFGFNFGVPLYYPAYPAYAPVYYEPAPVVVQTPPVVVSQPASQVVYQYFCPATNAYYPAVPTCSQPWLKVVPDGTAHN